MTWQASAAPLVASAVEGKYGAASLALVERRLAELAPVIDAAATEAELRAGLAAPDSADQDIANQLVVLALIETWWRREEHPGVVIREVHRALFGDVAVDALREEDDISDFGGSTLTPWQEVAGRLDELEHGCRALCDGMAGASPALKAGALAYVFASIVRIHPFPDGNGRTARMYVQYLLRRWGHSYLVIPKVRNDPAWREALDRAMNGDIPALQSQFEQRMMQAEGAA